jgi:hypothetical protein
MKNLTQAEAQQIIGRAQRDPTWWIKTVLGVDLWQRQKEIAQSVADNVRTAVRSDSGSGKSYVASCVALWFLYNHYPSTVITTAPTFRQVESILWREISSRFGGAKVPLSGRLNSTNLNIEDNWFAIGLSTDQPERFQGFHNKYTLVIGDEASGLSEEVYAAIENPLSSGNAKLLLIGNPTQSIGTFRSAFTSEIYRQFHISAFDTPNFTQFGITLEDIKAKTWQAKVTGPLPYPTLITPNWVAERFQEWGEGSFLFQVYVMGNFPEAGVNNLMKLSDIEKCTNQGLKAEGISRAALDISRYGDDETVFMLAQGNKVTLLEAWGHQDTVYTAGRTARLMRTHTPTITTVDSIGVGGGVADILKAEGLPVNELNVGAPALDTEQFYNRRAELYWLLSKKVENGEVDIPDSTKLKAQLADVRYKYNIKGQLVIESKEEMRARGSKSPDYADTLMMLMGVLANRVVTSRPVSNVTRRTAAVSNSGR